MASTAADPTREEPSLGQLVRSVSQDMSTLVRGEIELAKADLSASAKSGAKGGALVGVAIGLITAAGLLLTFAAVYGLSETGLPLWACFLIVAAVYILIAVIIGVVARSQFQKLRVSTRSVEQAKETVEVLKQHKPLP